MWKCRKCLTSKTREAKGTVRQKQAPEPLLARVLMEINSKLAEIPAIKSEGDTLLLIKKTVDKMEEFVQCMSEQYDEVLPELKGQSTEIAVFNNKVEQGEAHNASHEVRKLQQQVNSQ